VAPDQMTKSHPGIKTKVKQKRRAVGKEDNEQSKEQKNRKKKNQAEEGIRIGTIFEGNGTTVLRRGGCGGGFLDLINGRCQKST